MSILNQPFQGQLGNILIDKIENYEYTNLTIFSAFAKNSGVLRLKASLEKFRWYFLWSTFESFFSLWWIVCYSLWEYDNHIRLNLNWRFVTSETLYISISVTPLGKFINQDFTLTKTLSKDGSCKVYVTLGLGFASEPSK